MTAESQEAALAAFKKHTAQPQSEGQSTAGGLLDAFTDGVAFGFGDNLTAAESAILGRTRQGDWFNYDAPFNERFDRALAAERAQNDRFSEERPIASTAANIAGAVAGGAGAAARGATLLGRGGSLARQGAAGVAEAAAYGAAHGAGAADGEDVAAGAEEGAIIGGLLGGPLAVASGGLSRLLQQPNAPTRAAVQQEAQRLYGIARQKNPAFPTYTRFAADVNRRMQAEGFDQALHPRTAVALRETLKRGVDGTPRLMELENVRKIASAAAKGATPDDARLTKMIRDGLDNFVEDTAPVPELRQARTLWRRVKSSQALDEIIEKAGRRAESGEGVAEATSLRNQLRTLLENPRRRSGFTKDELQALEEVVRGGPRAIRMMSSLSPSAGRLPLFA
ncbi:MAG: hypothetical protein AAF968_26865, partial [Pseudomonadota bacterium]